MKPNEADVSMKNVASCHSSKSHVSVGPCLSGLHFVD